MTLKIRHHISTKRLAIKIFLCFRKYTSVAPWRIEDQIVLSLRHSKETIDYRLHALLENKSRVMVLHCSVTLARKVFQVASENGFTNQGYAWFVTEDVLTRSDIDLVDYPIGLVAFTIDYAMNYKPLLHDVITLVDKATQRYVREQGPALMQEHVPGRACLHTPTAEQYDAVNVYYR